MKEQWKYVESIYHFTGIWEMPSQCGLMIRKSGADTFVILTELYESNTGTSVTEMMVTLATEIVNKHNIQPERTLFIVHIPKRSSRYTFFAETYYQALMKWEGRNFSNLNWKRLKEREIERLKDWQIES